MSRPPADAVKLGDLTYRETAGVEVIRRLGIDLGDPARTQALIDEINEVSDTREAAAASQALLGAALIVEDEQDRGGSLAGAAHRLRALATKGK
jgi:hypothetical protein